MNLDTKKMVELTNCTGMKFKLVNIQDLWAPKQFKEFLNDTINWKFIDDTLKKATPMEKLKK